MKTALLLAALLAAPSASRAASGPELGAGTTVTAGSRGYHRFSASADADWTLKTFEPYGWSQFDVDNYLWDLEFGAGTWKDLRDGVSVKGGLGVMVGHVDDTDSDQSALLLETAAEKRFGRLLAGAGYNLTAGSIGGPTLPASFSRTLHGKEPAGQGRRGAASSASSESYAYNELSGYLKFPVSAGRASVRVALGLPSNSDPLVSETAGFKWPVWKQLSATAALTFQESTETEVFGSLGAYWTFD